MYVTRSFLASTLLCVLVGCSSSSSSTSRAKDATTPDVAQPTPTDKDVPPPSDQTPGGGGCVYTKIAGTCKITSADRMTFTGTIDGAAVTLADNSVSATGKAIGTSESCTLNFLTQGTCTPCETSVGWCGEPAWEAYRAFSAKTNAQPKAAPSQP